jgi:aldose sugar dehydrogenase
MSRRPAFTWIILSAIAIPATAQTVHEPGLILETVVTGLQRATSMVFLDNDTFLINEQSTGRVRMVQNDLLLSQPVLDLPVAGGLEPGLHGMVKDPDFAENGFIYVYYSRSSVDGGSTTNIRVSRFHWTGSAFDALSEFVLHEFPVMSSGHHGGILAFGLDKTLFVCNGDQHVNTQTTNFDTDTTIEVGVVLRMNRDGSAPADNPFATVPGWEYIYAYGARNQYGIGVDPLTGELWQSENGPDNATRDEVNLMTAGTNSGWEDVFGFASSPPTDLYEVPGSHYSDPEFVTGVRASPTAVTFQPSPVLGANVWNDVFIGEGHFSANRRIYRFDLNAARDGFDFTDPNLSSDHFGATYAEMSSIIFAEGFNIITDIEIAPNGFMYISTWTGTVYRIKPDHPTGDGDADGDIDKRDFAQMQRCFTGPGGSASSECRNAFDFDSDKDIDTDDFDAYLDATSGPIVLH